MNLEKHENNELIKSIRVEMSVKNGVTASVMFDYYDKEFMVFEIYHLKIADIDNVRSLCDNKGMAVIHMQNDKLKNLSLFKIKNFPNKSIPVVDRLSEEDYYSYSPKTNISNAVWTSSHGVHAPISNTHPQAPIPPPKRKTK
jgi:hypothetical protein